MVEDMIAYNTPRTSPEIISVGKCTNKYILENAINNANNTAGIPIFLLYIKIETAAAIEADECPDGKDESNGSFINKLCLIASSYINGLTLSNIFLIITFVNNRERISAPADTTPIFLYFLKNKSTIVIAIQKIPASPKCVINTIILSNTGLCILSIALKISNSIFTDFLSFFKTP